LLLASLFFSAALRAETKLDKSSLVNWREAQPSTKESELDRLNRAFVSLASESPGCAIRPPIQKAAKPKAAAARASSSMKVTS
jgi:hypothetical protein